MKVGNAARLCDGVTSTLSRRYIERMPIAFAAVRLFESRLPPVRMCDRVTTASSAAPKLRTSPVPLH
jgi:hypothetical protein